MSFGDRKHWPNPQQENFTQETGFSSLFEVIFETLPAEGRRTRGLGRGMEVASTPCVISVMCYVVGDNISSKFGRETWRNWLCTLEFTLLFSLLVLSDRLWRKTFFPFSFLLRRGLKCGPVEL